MAQLRFRKYSKPQCRICTFAARGAISRAGMRRRPRFIGKPSAAEHLRQHCHCILGAAGR